MTELLSFAELFGVGIGVGLVGALLGIGGGLIMVPLFMLTMMTPNGTTFQTVQQVIGTSLFGVFLNSVSGTIAYIRQKRVMFRAALPFAAATIPGAFLGSYVTEYFSGPGFSITFGVSLAALGIFMFLKSRSRRATARVEDFDVAHAEFSYTIGITLSFFVGFISSILGIGGGVVHVPMMVFILGFPAQIAVATSTFVLMVRSVIGVASHAMLGHIVWTAAVAVGCGAFVGAQFGAKIAKKIRPSWIVILLSAIMVLLGCELFWRGVSA